MSATAIVRDNPARQRFELLVDDRVVGFAEYRIHGDRVVLPHTVVDPAWRGQGLGAVLVGRMLDELSRPGRTIVPACSYVASYLGDHPEEARRLSVLASQEASAGAEPSSPL